MPRYIRSKSPRQKFWPPRYDNGIPVPQLREMIEDIRLCEGLVSMFNELVDLNLSIKWNNNEQSTEAFITETGEINVPKMHPNRKIFVKHEISHPAFGSDFDKIKAFLDYMENYLDPFGRLPESTMKALREDISLIHNIFEDERVNSCWGLAFPGDGRALEEWATGEIGPELYRKACKQYKKGDIDNIALYIVLTILAQPAKSSKWGKYKKEILDAAEDVKLTNFDYCLARIKKLIVDIMKDQIKDLEQQNNQPSSGRHSSAQNQSPKQGKKSSNQSSSRSPFTKDKAQDAVSNFVSPHSRPDHDKVMSENSGMTYRRTAKGKGSDEAKDHVQKVMALNDKDLKKLKESGKNQMIDMVHKTMQSSDSISVTSAKNNPVVSSETMTQLESSFNVHRVTSGNEMPITPEIKSAASKMRREFDKIKAKKKRTQEYAGSRLDIGAVIRNRVAMTNEPYYDYWKNSRGYEMVIILDCSSSMSSSQEDLEKLFSTLRLALKGLKDIKLTVFGFSGRRKGQTEIFMWDNSPYLFGGEMNIHGSTPMPQAIAFVKQVITSKKNKKKSVLFIGDGYPVFTSSRGSITTENLMWWVRQQIEDLTKFGIRTYGLMIGSSLPSDEEMSQMFLSESNWVKLPREELLKAASDYIKKEFMKELR